MITYITNVRLMDQSFAWNTFEHWLILDNSLGRSVLAWTYEQGKQKHGIDIIAEANSTSQHAKLLFLGLCVSSRTESIEHTQLTMLQ
jgi:hypothetical protein